MSRKRYTAEQIIGHLRQAELNGGKRVVLGGSSPRAGAYPLGGPSFP
jgi:hypothetical protein